MQLFELQPGAIFQIPSFPEDGPFKFVKMDGAYGQALIVGDESGEPAYISASTTVLPDSAPLESTPA